MVTVKIYLSKDGVNSSGYYPEAKEYYFGGFRKGMPILSLYSDHVKQYKRFQDATRAVNRIWKGKYSFQNKLVKAIISQGTV